MWILTRPKLKDGVKYYGSYLGGFPERARALLGVRISESVLHVCGGMARHYPYSRAIGLMDKTLDLDPSCKPDYLRDARESFPEILPGWPGILIDPPYSEADAEFYKPGASKYPKPNQLLKNAYNALMPGGRVGIIHYILPQISKELMKPVAYVGVIAGSNNRIRIYSVFEKL